VFRYKDFLIDYIGHHLKQMTDYYMLPTAEKQMYTKCKVKVVPVLNQVLCHKDILYLSGSVVPHIFPVEESVYCNTLLLHPSKLEHIPYFFNFRSKSLVTE
jgi:hypothetical protein